MARVLERVGAVVAALLVFLALFPAYGNDSGGWWASSDGTVGVSFSFFGNRVPTDDSRLAAAVGLVTLLVLWIVAVVADARRRSASRTARADAPDSN